MAGNKCIDNNKWLEYSLGKLSITQLNEIILHTNNCIICADIKNGIDTMPQPEMLGNIIVKLNSKIDKKTTSYLNFQTIFRYSSAAAVFIALIGLAWYFGNNRKSEIVINKIEESINKNNLDISKDSSIDYTINSQKNKIETHEKYIEKPIINQFSDSTGIKKAEEISLSLNEAPVENDNGGIATTEDLKDINESKDSEGDNDKNLNEIETVRPSSISKNIRLKKSKRQAKESAPSNKYYNNSNIGEDDVEPANAEFEVDSLFYSNALNLYNLNKFDSCISILNSKQTMTNSLFFEKILFLKAKTLIKLNRNEEAKIILNELIKLNGTHFRKAKKLLKKINKS